MEACENIDILKVILFVKEIINIILFLIPIAILIMLTIDFFKNVTASKEDEMSKNLRIAGKRLIYVVVIFLVPTIVNFTMNIVGDLGVDYAACYNNATSEIIEEKAVLQAQNAITTLENNKTRENLNLAQEAILKINDKDKREELNNRVKIIENQIVAQERE